MSFNESALPSSTSSSPSSAQDASLMLYGSPNSSATSSPPSISSIKRFSDSNRDSPMSKYFRDRKQGFQNSVDVQPTAEDDVRDGAAEIVDLARSSYPGHTALETVPSPSPNANHTLPATLPAKKTGSAMNSWREGEGSETRSKRWSLDSATTDSTLVDPNSPSPQTTAKSYFATQTYRPSLLSRGVYHPSDPKKSLYVGGGDLVREGFTGKGMRPLLLLSRRSSSYTDDSPSRESFPSPTVEPPVAPSSPIGLGISFQPPSPSSDPASIPSSPVSSSSSCDSDSEYDALPHIPLPFDISNAVSAFVKFLSPDAFDLIEDEAGFDEKRENAAEDEGEKEDRAPEKADDEAIKSCLKTAGSPPRAGVKGVRFDVLPPRHIRKMSSLETVLIRSDTSEDWNSIFSFRFAFPSFPSLPSLPTLPTLQPLPQTAKPPPTPPQTNIPLLFLTFLLSVLVAVLDWVERGAVGVVRGWVVGEMMLQLEGARDDERRRLVRRSRRKGRAVAV
ncbi:hypothetical protein L202_03251 [Cryptococcus amylolentus CBS 6039]|uniref:Uncharacterized protein n=1 Tax=Cryptococcus amylolentus CBS 6039 TaxID=1295533 RepID=A0A1E3HXU7_9TREE|nr:hypothetical protein L202_03251 [Cryptococcus amylolentus CBS 6039]ODN81160.1 hypothetical protein L202_03251 [Cryptococcus amylolentus CBS 6039]